MLGCPELVELVTEYVEGALTPERHHEVHEHLLECADCLRYLGQVALTSQLLATLPAPELTSELEAQLARDFRTASERPGPPRGLGSVLPQEPEQGQRLLPVPLDG